MRPTFVNRFCPKCRKLLASEEVVSPGAVKTTCKQCKTEIQWRRTTIIPVNEMESIQMVPSHE